MLSSLVDLQMRLLRFVSLEYYKGGLLMNVSWCVFDKLQYLQDTTIFLRGLVHLIHRD